MNYCDMTMAPWLSAAGTHIILVNGVERPKQPVGQALRARRFQASLHDSDLNSFERPHREVTFVEEIAEISDRGHADSRDFLHQLAALNLRVRLRQQQGPLVG